MVFVVVEGGSVVDVVVVAFVLADVVVRRVDAFEVAVVVGATVEVALVVLVLLVLVVGATVEVVDVVESVGHGVTGGSVGLS